MNHRRHRNGETQLADAYDAHAAALYRFALMILTDVSSAEDVIQQVFVKLAADPKRLRSMTSPKAYLRAAVRNGCYRCIAARREYQAIDPHQHAVLHPVDASLTTAEEQRAIEAALRALPVEQREVVHLKIYEQMTFEEIADLCGISLNTAASRYRYAVGKLRQLLATIHD